MDSKIKYLILIILLLLNFIIQIPSFNLWNIFSYSLVIIVLFYQFIDYERTNILIASSYLMMPICIINVYIGLVNGDWIKVYGFFAFLLFLTWVSLKYTLSHTFYFFLIKNHLSIALIIANIDLFFYPNHLYMLTHKGYVLNLLNRFDEGLVFLEKAEKLNCTDHFLYFHMGNCWANLEDYEKAVNYYKLAIDKNPNDFYTFYNISVALATLGRFNDALDYVDRALELDENNEMYELKDMIYNELN